MSLFPSIIFCWKLERDERERERVVGKGWVEEEERERGEEGKWEDGGEWEDWKDGENMEKYAKYVYTISGP